MANNIVVSESGPARAPLIDDPIDLKWIGNIFFGAETGLPADSAGVRVVDPKLTQGEDNIYRPAPPGSPAIGAAESFIGKVTQDIDNQPRPATGGDAGCDQKSDEKPTTRPLTPAEVGPAYMRDAATSQKAEGD